MKLCVTTKNKNKNDLCEDNGKMREKGMNATKQDRKNNT